MKVFKPITIDNLVEKQYQDEIYRHLTDVKFPWAFMADATDEFGHNNSALNGPTPSFGHLAYWNQRDENPSIDFYNPLLTAIQEKFNIQMTGLLRIRVGFLLTTAYSLPSMPYRHNKPHQDYDQDHFTLVYYVNDTDGDTVIFHETRPSEKYYSLEKCSPKKGRAILFDGRHFHASTCPKMFTTRIAITINFQGLPQ